MVKPSRGIGCRYGGECASDCLGQCVQRPGSGLAQRGFHFRPHRFDWIEVRTVRRQIPCLCADIPNHFLYGRALVRSQVVHHHDISATQGRNKNPFDIGPEHGPIGWALNDHRRSAAVQPQGGQHRGRAPMTAGGRVHKTLPSDRATIEPDHVGFGAGFVKEHEPTNVHIGQMLPPDPTSRPDVRPILLGSF